MALGYSSAMIFDHIGLFVEDIGIGKHRLSSILPIREWCEVLDDDVLHVRVCFGKDQFGLRYELVAPLGSPNPVSGVLSSRRNILNHVAYRVPDIAASAAALRAQRSVPIGPPKPAVAFGGALVMFFMTPLSFIIEIIEDAKLTA